MKFLKLKDKNGELVLVNLTYITVIKNAETKRDGNTIIRSRDKFPVFVMETVEEILKLIES